MRTDINYPGQCHHSQVAPRHLVEHLSWATSSTDGRPMHAIATVQIGETLTGQPVVIVTDDLDYVTALAALLADVRDDMIADQAKQASLTPMEAVA